MLLGASLTKISSMIFRNSQAGLRDLWLVALVEIVVAGWLFSGFDRRKAIAVAALAFAGFSVISAGEAFRGLHSCGCFGDLTTRPMFVACADIFICIALLGALSKKAPLNHLALAAAFLGTVTLVLAFPVVWGLFTQVQDVSSNHDGRRLSIDVRNWTGRKCPIIPFVDRGGALMTGTWLVVVFRQNCSVCQSELATLEAFARQSEKNEDSPRVAIVQLPPYATTPTNTYCTWFRLDPNRLWSATTPQSVLLIDGKVLGQVRRIDSDTRNLEIDTNGPT
jgi:hypothetical protein